jgi:hypothetical protein
MPNVLQYLICLSGKGHTHTEVNIKVQSVMEIRQVVLFLNYSEKLT